MNRITYFISALLLVCKASVASSLFYTAANFEQINAIYKKEIRLPAKTLIVFDIDDTLLTMTQSLGSVAWWRWQSTLLKTGKDPEKHQAKDMQQLAKLQSLFFQLIKMQRTDKDSQAFIEKALQEGVFLMAITARSNKDLGVTLDQMYDNGFIDAHGDLIFKNKRLELKDSKLAISGFACDDLVKPALYYEGILFVEGQDKGLALQCALAQAKVDYEQVIFVDDAKDNLDAVERVFKDSKRVQVISILFTKRHQHQEFLTYQEQELAFLQWENIKNAISQNIISSAIAAVM